MIFGGCVKISKNKKKKSEKLLGLLSSKDPTLLFVLSLGASPVSHGKDQRKIPSGFSQRGKRKTDHFETHQNIVFLAKSALRRNAFDWLFVVWT